MNQQRAADMLNISRGNLNKSVTENICTKFGITTADIGLLINKAIELDYHKYIPRSLCKISVRILNHTIHDKYFNSSTNDKSIHQKTVH